MMPEPIYTQAQIEEAWLEYKTRQTLRVLKDGKWKIYVTDGPTNRVESLFMTGPQLNDATRAELVKISTVMSFPKYLKGHYD
jgi:hypothetical protein